MKTLIRPAACVVACTLAGAVAQAQSPGCGDAQFSQQVLSRFPRIAETCLDVVTRGGEEYAVIKGDLLRVRGDTLRVRFKLPDGSRSDARDIKTKPDFRVQVGGKPTRVRDLSIGQELTAYVHVTRPVIALAPASEQEPLDAVPLEDSGPVLASAAMPDTAGPVPMVGLFGVLFLTLGAGLTAARRLLRRG